MFARSRISGAIACAVLMTAASGASAEALFEACNVDYGSAENQIRDEVCASTTAGLYCSNVFGADGIPPHDHINNMARWDMYAGDNAGTFYSTILREAAANPNSYAFAWAAACAGALPPGPRVEY
jgi:hypothetical protein